MLEALRGLVTTGSVLRPGLLVITSASNVRATDSLEGQRINIRLDYLRVYQYPTPLFNLRDNIQTILFDFEARNQVEQGKEEPVAFNQLYKARSGKTPQ